MRASIFLALQASFLSTLVQRTVAQTGTAAAPGSITTLECYSNADPLTKLNTNSFQTSGLCQESCGTELGKPVMAIVGGSTCYCGDELPALDMVVDDSKCDTPCPGFGTQECGGIGYWRVYLTGVSGDVQHVANSTSSSASGASTSRTSATQATVIVTASSTSKAAEKGDGGPSKVGIAVGVVVGVIAIGAVIGGIIFYMKQKRRREIEEEHKAQAAITSFAGSRSSDTKSDARLDPSVASSYRRESIGSIADERDFSRRILQVRNPDRGSMNSVA